MQVVFKTGFAVRTYVFHGFRVKRPGGFWIGIRRSQAALSRISYLGNRDGEMHTYVS